MCVAYFMASSVSFSRRSRHETHYDRLNQSEFAGLSLLREMNNIPDGDGRVDQLDTLNEERFF